MNTYYRKDEVLAMADRLAKLDVYGCNRDGAEMLRAFAQTLADTNYPEIPEGSTLGEPVAVPNAVVAGALFDFLGFLTTRDEPVTFSGSHFAGTAVEVLREWNERIGLNLDEADVTKWRSMLSAAPHHPTTEKGCE